MARARRDHQCIPLQGVGSDASPVHNRTGPNTMNPTVETSESPIDFDLEIEPEHEATARAYIEAILRRGQAAGLVTAEVEAAERRRLWGRFATRYVEVTTPPLAKRGADALRSALLNI
jgi:hypothetical protein